MENLQQLILKRNLTKKNKLTILTIKEKKYMSEQYEDITNTNKTVSSAKLAVGASIQGRLLSIETSAKYANKKNLVMEGTDGNNFTVFTSGTLNYAVEDGKFEIGRTYKITRLENKTTKAGASRTQFQIQRLREDGSAAAPTQNDVQPAGGR